MTTIRDVAARAGVSVGTASKAMNNKGQLTAITRERVLKAAEELNFTPNALICSLQRGQTHTVGILAWPVQIGDLCDITMPLLKGISEGVASGGRDLLMYSYNRAGSPQMTPTMLLDGRVDGLILGPTTIPAEGVTMLAAAGLPLVVLYNGDIPDSVGSVRIDNTGGVAAAMDHLVALGHRRIAFYGPQHSPDMRERFASYRSSLERHGLSFDPAICISDEVWDVDVEQELQTMLALPDAPTAMMAGDDYLAFAWIAALKAGGKRIPEDMSVVGFDDAPAAANSPGLTTIRQPAEQIGQVAGQFVIRLIEGARVSDCRVILPVELVVRASTAPPSRI